MDIFLAVCVAMLFLVSIIWLQRRSRRRRFGNRPDHGHVWVFALLGLGAAFAVLLAFNQGLQSATADMAESVIDTATEVVEEVTE